MDFIRKYTITCAALALWLITGIIFDASELLFGLAVGAFLFEQNLAPMISDQIKKLIKLD